LRDVVLCCMFTIRNRENKMHSNASALLVVTSSGRVAYVETSNNELFSSEYEQSRLSEFLFGDPTLDVTHVVLLGGQAFHGFALPIEVFTSSLYQSHSIERLLSLPHFPEIGNATFHPLRIARQDYRDIEYRSLSHKSLLRIKNRTQKTKKR